MIKVYPVNNIQVQIDCPRDIARELNEFFSFFAEGYRFHPAYKQKRWDGKLRLYKTLTSTIYRGLVPRVVEFAQERGYDIELDPTLTHTNDISLEKVQTFLQKLNFSSKGKSIELRDYQIEAVHHCLVHQRALIQSPTSSGKSAIIAAISRFLQKKFSKTGQKILIVVPNVNLVNQFAYDFCDYFSQDVEWLQSEPVHTIFGGQDKDVDNPILISTWQSLHKMPKDYFKQFGCIIVDEVHLAEAAGLTKIIDQCTEAEWRFGFTGSLKKTKVHVLSLEGMFGKVHTTITTKELMENNQVTELEIKALLLKHPDDVSVAQRKINDYKVEVDLVVASEKRNKFICKLALAQKSCGLILVNQVDGHAKPLLDMLQDMTERPVFYISGEVSGTKREEIRLAMEQNPDAIIVATYATLSTGVNIPSLHWLIFGSPTKSYTRVVQSIGRILRLHHSKNKVVLFDLVDDMRVKLRVNTHDNYCWKHFMERLNFYQEQKFEVDVKQIPLFQ